AARRRPHRAHGPGDVQHHAGGRAPRPHARARAGLRAGDARHLHRTIEDVESYLGVRVLGIIPHIDPHETMQRLIERRPGLAQVEPDALQSHALLITHFDPKSPVAEAYRTLRTNIQFERIERGGKVLVVTSPTLQEGKTTTIVNLALTMAQNGQKTLLVGGNMRRP